MYVHITHQTSSSVASSRDNDQLPGCRQEGNKENIPAAMATVHRPPGPDPLEANTASSRLMSLYSSAPRQTPGAPYMEPQTRAPSDLGGPHDLGSARGGPGSSHQWSVGPGYAAGRPDHQRLNRQPPDNARPLFSSGIPSDSTYFRSLVFTKETKMIQ